MHGGEWTVEDGAIVGRKGVEWTTNPETSGSWLRTEKEYGDFVFEPLQNHDDKAVVKFRNLRITEKL